MMTIKRISCNYTLSNRQHLDKILCKFAKNKLFENKQIKYSKISGLMMTNVEYNCFINLDRI